MRRLLACLSVLAVSAAVPVVLTASPAFAAEKCQGQTATIVGNTTDKKDITGTSGADVIVTNGAQTVDTGDGGDLVCITGRSASGSVTVTDGIDDDEVRVAPSAKGDKITVTLTLGDDTFVGGDGPEVVFSESGADTIRTGGGYDKVTIGRYALEEDYRGHVDLGAGGGEVFSHEGRLAPMGSLDGGSGRSLLRVSQYADDGAVGSGTGWSVDVASGKAYVDGVERLDFDHFTDFDFTGQVVRDFTGTAASETLKGSLLGDVDMGGGNDAITTSRASAPMTGDLQGGAGVDTLNVSANTQGWSETLKLDLGAARLVYDAADPTIRVAGFEKVEGTARTSATVIGNNADNTVRYTACTGTLRGGGGNDRLTFVAKSSCPDKGTRKLIGDAGNDTLTGSELGDVLQGGPGNDKLQGRGGNDRLEGGSGRDVLVGGTGTDTCTGERLTSCER